MNRGLSREFVRKIQALLLVVVFCLSAFLASGAVFYDVKAETEDSNSEASESSSEAIRLGFIVIENYNYLDANDEWRGYDIELILKLEQYGSLEIEGVPCYTSAEALDMLRNGEVDGLIDFNRTAEREAEFLLSSYSVASDALVIYGREDDDRFSYGDVTELDGIKIGTIEGSGVNELLPEYLGEYGITPQLVPMGTDEALTQALDSGRVDAACTGSNSTPKGYTTIYSIMTDAAYILYQKGNTALKDVLDTAMAKLLSAEPDYISELSAKYVSQSSQEKVTLTREEQQYIEEHPTVKVALPASAAPFVTTDENGNLSGMLPDYYARLSEKTGLEFKCVSYESSAKAQETVLNGEADVVGMYYGDIITADGEGLVISSCYSPSSDCVLLCGLGDEDSVKAVAVTVRTEQPLRVQLIKAGRNMEIKAYPNIASCYDAYKSGEVDGIVCSMTSAGWLLNQHTLERMTMVSMPDVALEICGCTLKADELLTILNKAIAISESDYQSLAAKYSVTDQKNLRTVIENIPVTMVLFVSLVIVAILSALIVSMNRIARQNKERAVLAEKAAETEKKEAQLQAERTFNENRSAFFSNISHDMRTPLNAIIGFSEIASQSDDPEEIHGYLDKIHTSGDILLDLINDTLTISKLNNGKMTLSSAPCDTKPMLEGLGVPIRAAAEKKGVTLITHLPEENYTIICDELNLKKILLNLLSNAVKYTGEGGQVVFTAGMTPIEEESSSGTSRTLFRAEVADTGRGMRKEFLPHIFEPFAQESNKFGVSSGVGLGLAIVKQLVEAMGGTVTADSELGKGSTFTVEIPFEETKPKETKEEAQVEEEIDLKGKKILLCEDNALNTEIACAILDGYGAIVTTAENGEIGVAKFSDSVVGEFSLILMDLRMPIMNGYEAAEAIRALDRADAKTVPIVAMSADAFQDDADKCLAAGMNGHIPKPIDMEKLKEVLKSI